MTDQLIEMTPAEELREAATKLRVTALHSIGGPWESLDGGDRLVALTESGREWAYVAEEPIGHAGTAAWMALANPLLAEPLAAWLEWAADIARDHPWDPDYDGMPDLRWCTSCQNEETSCVAAVDRALTVARLINRGGQGTRG